MNIEAIKDFAMSKVARQVLQTQKHSPRILFAAGVVGVVGATVLACRATLKVSDVLDNHEKQRANLVKRGVDSVLGDGEEDVIELNAHNNRLKIKTGLDIAKLYIPAAVLMAGSVVALTGSHIILTKRNTAVMAAYAGMQKAYDEYRSRVAGKYGADEDRLFASGMELKHVEEKTADGKIIKQEPRVTGRFGGSPYAALYDEKSHKFTREPGMNSMVVGMQQSHANDKLRANGHLFLNEVHDMLGLPRTKAGAVVGWVWRRDNEEKTGDNYVSFGIFDDDLERGDAFVNGDENSIWLDFNVDGVILDLI